MREKVLVKVTEHEVQQFTATLLVQHDLIVHDQEVQVLEVWVLEAHSQETYHVQLQILMHKYLGVEMDHKYIILRVDIQYKTTHLDYLVIHLENVKIVP